MFIPFRHLGKTALIFSIICFLATPSILPAQIPLKDRFFSKNSNAKKLVVFVHGLNGHPFQTWTSRRGEESFQWIKELYKDKANKNLDVYTFQYKSGCRDEVNFQNLARKLNSEIKDLPHQRYDSVSFIATNLGGLVVRQFILDYYKENNIEAAILLGTPNLGESLERLLKTFCGQGKWNKEKLENHIKQLNVKWRNEFQQNQLGNSLRPKMIAGYELIPFFQDSQELGILVGKYDATAFSSFPRPLFKDHVHLTKPYGNDDPLYIWVKQHLFDKLPVKGRQPIDQDIEDHLRQISQTLLRDLHAGGQEKLATFISDGNFNLAFLELSKLEKKKKKGLSKAKISFFEGQIHELKQDFEIAKNSFQEAVEEDPKNSNYLNRLGTVQYLLREFEEAQKTFESALKSIEKEPKKKSQNRAKFHSNLGKAWFSLGELDKAEEYYKNALNIDKKKFGKKDHPLIVQDLVDFANVWVFKGDYGKGLEYFQKAFEMAERLWGQRHPALSRYLVEFGRIFLYMGKNGEAEKKFLEAYSINKETFGPVHPSFATDFTNLGQVQFSRGEYKKAIENFNESLKIDLIAFGEDDPIVAEDYSNLGGASSHLDYKKATAYYEKALKINIGVLGPDHPDLAESYSHLGLIWFYQGIYEKAVKNYQKALSINKKRKEGEFSQLVAQDYNDLGNALSSKGNFPEAARYLEEALKLDKQLFGEDSIYVARDYNNLASAYYSAKEYPKAKENYKKALRIQRKVYGLHDPNVGGILNNLGIVSSSLGENEPSKKYFEDALEIFKKNGMESMAKLVKRNLENLQD